MTFHANFFRKMALGAVCACAGISCADDALLATFRQPPPAARPEVWWHWMNGNVSRAGIVADLDAMAAVVASLNVGAARCCPASAPKSVRY